MKIRCDVCDKDEASVFCVADEAALCSACDHRVHHANKLAGKHHRFSLLLPSPKQIPICDICQERRAFLFCQQDRAILCRECDIPIHKANEHTQKHNRFLLTGVKVSANSSLYSSNSTTEATESTDIVHHQISKSKAISTQQSPILKNPIAKDKDKDSSSILDSQMVMNGGEESNVPKKSLSEYSIDMLQGWHVDDFLDSSSPYGFCENGSNGSGDMMPFWDADFGRNVSSYSPESSGAWVPQVATPLYSDEQFQSFPSFNMPTFGDQISSFKETKDISTFKPSKKWSDDNSFAVPQINPHSTISNKRSRNLR